MRLHRWFSVLFVVILLCATAAPLAVQGPPPNDHWVMRPCPQESGVCFQATTEVGFMLEPPAFWGPAWGPEWDDGDGIPEVIFYFYNYPEGNSWYKNGPKDRVQRHGSNPATPVLWCDSSRFAALGVDLGTFVATMFKYFASPDALALIKDDLTEIWEAGSDFADLGGCFVGVGRYQENYVIQHPYPGDYDQFNWEAQVVGVASDREGTEYNIKFRLKMQEPRNIAWPEGLHLQHIEFTSTPIVPR